MSEVGPLGRNSHSPRIPVRAQFDLTQHLHPGGGLFRQFETELRHAIDRPAISLLGRFAHDEHPADAEKRRCTFGDSRWRAEQPGRNRVDRSSPCRIATHILGSGVQDDHPVIPAQGFNGVLEKCDPTLKCVEQNETEIWPGIGDHETRYSAPGTEIDDHGSHGHLFECRHESPGMRDVVLDGTGTEYSKAASPIQGHLQTC
jgi:hypothetical protein